jgi:hypothetical protein
MSGVALTAERAALADLLVQYHAAGERAAVDPEAALARGLFAEAIRMRLWTCLVDELPDDPDEVLALLATLAAADPGSTRRAPDAAAAPP